MCNIDIEIYIVIWYCKYRINFDSAVPSYYLIKHWNPDKITHIEYCVPAIQIRDYTIEEIFDKNLLLLLPFYAFQFSEREYREMDNDISKIGILEKGIAEINERLNRLVKQGMLEIWQKRYLWNMIERVFQKVTLNYDNVSEGVKKIMGGQVLYLETDEILDKGREEERYENITNMLNRGKIPEEIAEFCGYSIELIREVQEKRVSTYA